MTKHSIVSLIALACCSVQAQATEYRFIADDHSTTTRLCVATAEDDLDGVRQLLRKLHQTSHYQYRTIVNAIRCNGEVPAKFARDFGATETFAYLYRLTAKKHRNLVPYTSAEEVAAAQQSDNDDTVVVVRISGR